jgi:hypothetical protein
MPILHRRPQLARVVARQPAVGGGPPRVARRWPSNEWWPGWWIGLVGSDDRVGR